MNTGVLGSLIVLPFLAFAFYGVLMGVPYLYNRLTTPWAGLADRSDTLTGTWVGCIPVQQASSSEAAVLRRESSSRSEDAKLASVELTVAVEFTWGVPKIRGTATVCGDGDQIYRSAYRNSAVLDPSRIQLLLRQETQPRDYSHLAAQLSPGALHIDWPFSGEKVVSGSLHKGSGAEFEASCKG